MQRLPIATIPERLPLRGRSLPGPRAVRRSWTCDRSLPWPKLTTTVPDIPVVQLLARDGRPGPTAPSLWAVDMPRGRRPSPLVLATLGVLAGIAAMALGSAAVLSAGETTETAQIAPSAQARPSASPIERRARTPREAEHGARSRSRDHVASCSRSGVAVVRRFRPHQPAARAKPYVAWIVAPGVTPARAAVRRDRASCLPLSGTRLESERRRLEEPASRSAHAEPFRRVSLESVSRSRGAARTRAELAGARDVRSILPSSFAR